MASKIQAEATALVIVDMQNDFIHPNGAYGRAGQTAETISALPARLKRLANTIRAAGGWIVSTHFTLVPGKAGEPFISEHLRSLRPFLAKGDFAPGSFGHDLIDELTPADLKVEKVAFSAFYQSRMDWMLRRAGIKTLVFGGIVTNGGVASTARDAHVRDYDIVILKDGCGAFSQEAHDATIESLATIARIASTDEIIKEF
ncbi:MAG: cysteine hydrolase [Magnetovibrio sp.]|nr:cysteine hydrolase [Magnetovibrio sp.]|tara:strand:+ start:2180 stop:2782 length:603 start_codon:yes stop_codon:yes gene_type:complete